MKPGRHSLISSLLKESINIPLTNECASILQVDSHPVVDVLHHLGSPADHLQKKTEKERKKHDFVKWRSIMIYQDLIQHSTDRLHVISS